MAAQALVHTAAASQLGQMLVKICAADGVPLVCVVRRPAQVPGRVVLHARARAQCACRHSHGRTVVAFWQQRQRWHTGASTTAAAAASSGGASCRTATWQVELLQALGARHVVDTSSPTYLRDLGKAMAATGATIAFDATGCAALLSFCFVGCSRQPGTCNPLDASVCSYY